MVSIPSKLHKELLINFGFLVYCFVFVLFFKKTNWIQQKNVCFFQQKREVWAGSRFLLLAFGGDGTLQMLTDVFFTPLEILVTYVTSQMRVTDKDTERKCGRMIRNVRDQVDSENRGAQYLKSEILVYSLHPASGP